MRGTNGFKARNATRPPLSAMATMALIAGLSSATSIASAQSFTGLGFPDNGTDNGTESYGRAVNNDGTVVGYGFIPPGPGELTGFRAFRWTETGGMENLGTLVGGQYSAGRGVNSDGAVAVGWSGTTTYTHAFRWTAAGLQDLGVFPSYALSQSYGVSGDGSIVVGSCGTSATYYRAFRWTNSGMQNLGTLSGYVSSRALAISSDGSTIVGNCHKGDESTNTAARWKNGTWTNLGKLKGGAYSDASAASSNGSVIIGTSDSNSGPRAYRWANNKLTSLGTLSGQPNSYGLAVSGNGSAVVGYASDGTTETLPDSGSIVTTGRAFLWTSSLGMVDLNSYLPTLGIDLTGWTLRETRGISPDGATITGWGWHDDGVNGPRPEAWIAQLN